MTDTTLGNALGAVGLAAAAATAPATPATPAATDDPNTFLFRIPNTETDMQINLATIPVEVKLDFLKRSLGAYVANAVNQAKVRADKANEPFDAYDAATAADSLQTAVPKPTGERVVADYIETAKAARERLYKGEVRRQTEGGKPRETRDPLDKMVTDAVARELHTKDKEAGGKRKYIEILAEVNKAGGGIAYLDAKIAEKVAQGADAAALTKFKEERYIKPAEMMLGKRDNKATKEVDLFA